MEKSDGNKNQFLCDDCKNLVGKGKYTQPHINLIEKEYKPVKSIFGSVDEYYYTCKKCNTQWLHEKGSYGEGWIIN